MPTPNLFEILIFTGCMAFVIVPVVFLMRRFFPKLSLIDQIGLGTSSALALQIATLHWACKIKLSLQAVFATAIATVCIVGFLRSKKKISVDRSHLGLLMSILLFQSLILSSTIWFSPLPHGTDPIYHVSIAQKILDTGHMPKDFLPFDPAKPNYPPGSHQMNAWLSVFSGLPVHRVYQFLMVTCLLCISFLIYGLGGAFFSPEVGLAAAFCFACMANWGGIDLMRWGSLPNLCAVIFLLTCLRLLLIEESRAGVYFFALCFAVMIQVHHLTSLMFGLFCALLFISHLTRLRPPQGFLRNLGFGILGGILLSSDFIITFASEVFHRLTSGRPAASMGPGIPFFNVAEPAILPPQIFLHLGPFLIVLAIVGVFSLKNKRKSPTPLWKRNFLWIWILSLAVPFIVFDWLTRFLLIQLIHQEISILTPSRFLTDLVYPLSLLAGIGLVFLWKNFRWGFGLIGLLACLYTVWIVSPLWKSAITPTETAGLIWFRDHTPPQSLLLENPLWSPYVTGREGAFMVLRQEELTVYTEEKLKLGTGGLPAIRDWMQHYRRPVYIWQKRALNNPNLKPLWTANGQYIYEIVF